MLTELAALLDLLSAKGVTHYVGPLTANALSPTVNLYLRPTTPVAAGVVTAEKEDDEPDADLCRCGHALYTHINGLCGDGCDVERCVPPEKP